MTKPSTSLSSLPNNYFPMLYIKLLSVFRLVRLSIYLTAQRSQHLNKHYFWNNFHPQLATFTWYHSPAEQPLDQQNLLLLLIAPLPQMSQLLNSGLHEHHFLPRLCLTEGAATMPKSGAICVPLLFGQLYSKITYTVHVNPRGRFADIFLCMYFWIR